jgi:methionyl-tRNA formyltransferase
LSVDFAFAGTPDFAAWVLSDLESLGRRPCLVISQPDRPRGRGRRAATPPAVVEAGRLGIPCLQAEDINEPVVAERLRERGAGTLVVAAFGQILKPALLESLLCLNIHASLLPAYRGAAPVERALAAGESSTGISIIRITEKLDEGPWALQITVSVGLREDAGTLGRTLALLGAVGMAHVLDGLADGTVIWTEQEGPSTYAEKLTARDCLLDFGKGARAVHDQVRALSPCPGVRAASGVVEFKVWRTWPYGQKGLEPVPDRAAAAAGRAGHLLVSGERLFAGCAEGVVEILVVQPVGKNRMNTPAFLRGYAGRLSDRIGPGDGTAAASADIAACGGGGPARTARGDQAAPAPACTAADFDPPSGGERDPDDPPLGGER